MEYKVVPRLYFALGRALPGDVLSKYFKKNKKNPQDNGLTRAPPLAKPLLYTPAHVHATYPTSLGTVSPQ